MGYFLYVRAKKKTYLKLMATAASAKPMKYVQRRRKAAEGDEPRTYTIMAPEAQQRYNQYKGPIDHFNRARLLYFRRGRDTVDHFHLFRLFWSMWSANAFFHFNARRPDGNKIAQFDYFCAALTWLFGELGIDRPAAVPAALPAPPPIGLTTGHWPLPVARVTKHCTAEGCSVLVRSICRACPGVRRCNKHLAELHGVI